MIFFNWCDVTSSVPPNKLSSGHLIPYVHNTLWCAYSAAFFAESYTRPRCLIIPELRMADDQTSSGSLWAERWLCIRSVRLRRKWILPQFLLIESEDRSLSPLFTFAPERSPGHMGLSELTKALIVGSEDGKTDSKNGVWRSRKGKLKLSLLPDCKPELIPVLNRYTEAWEKRASRMRTVGTDEQSRNVVFPEKVEFFLVVCQNCGYRRRAASGAHLPDCGKGNR